MVSSIQFNREEVVASSICRGRGERVSSSIDCDTGGDGVMSCVEKGDRVISGVGIGEGIVLWENEESVGNEGVILITEQIGTCRASTIVMFSGIINAGTIFEAGFLAFIAEKFSRSHRLFHNNDPKHSLYYMKINMNWWPTPPESPDLNPIKGDR